MWRSRPPGGRRPRHQPDREPSRTQKPPRIAKRASSAGRGRDTVIRVGARDPARLRAEPRRVRCPLMKIATWNVNGIRARQAQVQDWIEAERPDVVCLQEIKASPDQLPVWLCELEGYWCYWH